MVKRLYQKLAAKYFGSFEVLARVGAVAYKLKLPQESKIHNVFHVSQLKPVVGKDHSVSELPRSFSTNDEIVIEPDTVIDTRYDAEGHLEALISWTGLPDHENSWERVSTLIHQFPRLKLEDKFCYDAAGIDKPLRSYFSKRKRGAERAKETGSAESFGAN